MSAPVRVEVDGAVTTVVLARPERRNAIDRETADALLEAVERFDADPDQRVAVLWGEGLDFCAGADLHAIAAGGLGPHDADPSAILAPGNRVTVDGPGPLGPTRMLCSKTVIAAIAGHAVAGGLELALWCDLRVVEETAVLGVFCRRVGVPLIDGGTVRLPRLIGLSRALDLILTGRPVGALEAHQIGLANRVVTAGTSRAAAEALAARLAGHPQAAMNADRRSAYASGEVSLADALRAETLGGRSALEQAVAGAVQFARRG